MKHSLPRELDGLRPALSPLAGLGDGQDPVRFGKRFGMICGQSACDVVLAGKAPQDLLAADAVVGEVDQLRRLGVGLSW